VESIKHLVWKQITNRSEDQVFNQVLFSIRENLREQILRPVSDMVLMQVKMLVWMQLGEDITNGKH
jgi:hypothetical protein